MATIVARRTQKGLHYRAQVRMKGNRPVSATFERKTDAKKWVQDTESAIRERRYFKQTDALKNTMTDLIDRYTKEILPLKPKSLDRQLAQLNWWKKEIGHLCIADVTPDVLATCRNKLQEGNIRGGKLRSGGTVNRYLAALSHVFTIAVKEFNWLDSNPVQRITKRPEPKGRVRYLSQDEKDRLLNVCEGTDEPYLLPIVLVAISTGMRLGEITGLTWNDIDLKSGRIVIKDTKNGDTRVVPLVHKALEAIKEHAKVRRLDTQLVFPIRRNGEWKPWDIRNAWNKAVKKAELDDFRFHDLRHTAASYLAMNGASPSEIAAVLGHKTLQMVQRYAHLSEPHTRDVVTAMNEKLLA